MVCRQVCCQCPHNGDLGMLDLENHWFAERLAYLDRSLSKDTVWRQKASNTFPCLKSDPKAEGQCRWMGEVPFVPESSDLSQPQKEPYRDLVVGSASDPLMDQLG